MADLAPAGTPGTSRAPLIVCGNFEEHRVRVESFRGEMFYPPTFVLLYRFLIGFRFGGKLQQNSELAGGEIK